MDRGGGGGMGGYDQLLIDGGSTCVGSDDCSISLPDALQVDKL